MDLLKNLVVLALLAAAAGGVYILITNNPQTKPPPGVDENWSQQAGGLKVEVPSMPTMNASAPTGLPAMNGTAGPTGQLPTGALPPADPGNSVAPRFQPTPPASATQNDAEAPRFTPPNTNQYPNIPTAHTEPVQDSAASNLVMPSDSLRRPSTHAPQAADPNQVRGEFAAFIDAARKKLEEGGLAEAHERLSLFYGNPRLTPEENRLLTSLLDQVAGTVIYSRQHILSPPHVVQPGETLEQIGERYDVPWQLLAKVNGVRDPQQIRPGQELKVLRGPFNAVIHLDRFELTLMLHGRYAGRFPIGIGQDNQLLEGSYLVRDKTVNPTYYCGGRVVDADDPNNPLGERQIGLGNQVSLHGTNNPQSIGRFGGPGCIALNNRDIEDLFDILSINSRVVVQR
jgi:LysM repeat protein